MSRLLAAVVLLLLTGCGGDAPAPEAGTADPPPSADERWDTLSQSFIEDLFTVVPSFAVWAGQHDLDGRLADYSDAGMARRADVLRDYHERAQEFDPANLTDLRPFERELLIWYTDRSLFWLESARWPYVNPAFYRGELAPSVYVTREYAPPAERLAALTRWAENIPEALTRVKANLELPLPRTYVELGIGFFGGMADYLQDDVPAVFADVDDEAVQAAFAEANEGAVAAFRRTALWLESARAEATDDFAMGPALFSEMLWRVERVDMPLDELEALGQRDLDRNLDVLAETCEQITPGEGVEACVAAVSANKPEEGPVERGAEQLDVLEAFVAANDLVSIPSDQRALVREAPPYRRSNLAYINIPGPFERQDLPSIYYISPPDPSWSEEVQRAFVPAEARLMFVSIHEVWPGHFLWGLHRNRVARPLMQLVYSTAFAEGWAHYTEELMWEAGFRNDDPRMHVGQLVSALMRNVRFMSAIGLHTQGMTVAESERMFVEAAYLDRGNARQQAARGTYDPNYLAYTLGKLLIRDLRDSWTAERGGRDAWDEFHDTLLSYGGPPVPMVTAAMSSL